MLLFLDCEFTDFIDCELISIGLFSEDGAHELYLEVQDFARSACSPFVQAAVCSQLGKDAAALVLKTDLQPTLRAWFATLPTELVVAVDSIHDRDLLFDAFDGELPGNLVGWIDLRQLNDPGTFQRAVADYHSIIGHPWHHALHDACALRAGWIVSGREGGAK